MNTFSVVCLFALQLAGSLHLVTAGRFCNRPPTIRYSSVSVEPWQAEFPPGTQVQYTCDPGYQASSNNQVTCLYSNGRADWSETGFACQVASSTSSTPSWTTRVVNWWNKLVCSVKKC